MKTEALKEIEDEVHKLSLLNNNFIPNEVKERVKKEDNYAYTNTLLGEVIKVKRDAFAEMKKFNREMNEYLKDGVGIRSIGVLESAIFNGKAA